jgi:hypothetical protein
MSYPCPASSPLSLLPVIDSESDDDIILPQLLVSKIGNEHHERNCGYASFLCLKTSSLLICAASTSLIFTLAATSIFLLSVRVLTRAVVVLVALAIGTVVFIVVVFVMIMAVFVYSQRLGHFCARLGN